MFDSTIAFVISLVWAGVVAVTIIGWILNIVKMVNHGHAMEYAETVLRVIGIFVFPLGSVMGLFV